MMNSTSYNQKTSIQAPPVDMGAGRFESKSGALSAAFSVGMFLIAVIGFFLCTWSWPSEPFQPWTPVRFGGLAFGVTLIVAGGLFGFMAAKLTLRGWQEYQDYLFDQRQVYLNAYEAQGGQTVESEVRVDTLRPDDPGDYILALVYAYISGKHSIEDLRGPVLIGSRHLTRVGLISKPAAERFGRLFSAHGVVVGREERKAGQLQRNELSLEEAIIQAMDKWEG
jgi:hypothetical protein